MNTFEEFLKTITKDELDFIARLDYGHDFDKHRLALGEVVANGGVVNTDTSGVWFPLEVIELGRNHLEPGHEREFALCTGISLKTNQRGDELDFILDNNMELIKSLPGDLREMVENMISESMKECEPCT